MRIRSIGLVAAVAVLLGLPVAARADSVSTTGSPAARDLAFQITLEYSNIAIDATSGPNGENPSGRVSFGTNFGAQSGPVTCLRVDGRRAVIGFTDTQNGSGHVIVEVVDNGPGGALNPDTFGTGTGASPTDCSAGQVPVNDVTGGDFSVDDPVVDSPPALAMPRHLIADATGPGGAVVSFTASATDNEDPAPRVGCSPASGTAFRIGVTTVTCTATDAAGKTAQKRFPVVVRTPDQQVVAASGAKFAFRFSSIPFGPPGVATLDLVAVSGPGGRDLTAAVTVANSVFFIKRVTCLAVGGSKATVGVVTGSPLAPGIEDGAVLTVVDNGTPGINKDVLFLDFDADPTSCPAPSAFGATIAAGEATVVPARAAVRSMVGKGSVSGGGKSAAYVYRVPCAAAAGSGPPFEVRFGAQRFRLTSVRSVSCSNDPGVATPAAGFDTQSGSGSGTLTSGGPGRVDWKFVDGGAGGAKDSVQLTIRDASNAIVFQGSAAPPAAFPGSDQPTGSNTAQAL